MNTIIIPLIGFGIVVVLVVLSELYFYVCNKRR